MIDDVDHTFGHDVFQSLQIDDHPCLRIDAPSHADLNGVIVTMTAGVIALVEGLAIPRRVVLRVVQAMRSGERQPGRNDHNDTAASAGRISLSSLMSFSRMLENRSSFCRKENNGLVRIYDAVGSLRSAARCSAVMIPSVSAAIANTSAAHVQ